MLQTAHSGGACEYVPFMRGDDDAGSFAAVGGILDGDARAVQVPEQAPGALVIFRGARTLHRVTATAGTRTRLVAVFSYSHVPGYALDPHPLHVLRPDGLRGPRRPLARGRRLVGHLVNLFSSLFT